MLEHYQWSQIRVQTSTNSFTINKSKHSVFFKRCIKQLEQNVNFVTGNTSNKVFLAQDLGRFGDSVADKYMSNDLMETVQDSSFKAVYNGAMNMRMETILC